ncbi:MAG TPA: 2-aminoethylphosphonate--pyruvate transaminase [Victivallales bacterium]|nr:2-aminoethylphosphonate--pyruvate transaminase [Victivallales bacterium]
MIKTWKDKVLHTPGPLTTSQGVKHAMLRDLGSRDNEFINIVRNVREKLLRIGEVSSPEYEAVILQGSGTFSLEAVLSSFTPPDGKWLIIINGAYGKRFAHLAEVLNIDYISLEFEEDEIPSIKDIDAYLDSDLEITHISMVHCETTSGIINPIKEVGRLAAKHNKKYFVDAMSSFGAVPVNIAECNIDYIVSSANKCIEGVPGFSFVIAKRDSMLDTEGYARSVCFDLLEQWKGLEKTGQFRFTPPTHSLLAFKQALSEFEEEGGVQGRADRYRNNYQILLEGMRKLGFKEYLRPEDQGYIITTFHIPEDPNFSFDEFYNKLNDYGYVIYPGKVGSAACFRIGNIGRLFSEDMYNILNTIARVLEEMKVK